MGIVVGTSAGNDTVKVMPLHEEIRDTILDFQMKQLMKYVKVWYSVCWAICTSMSVASVVSVVSVSNGVGFCQCVDRRSC